MNYPMVHENGLRETMYDICEAYWVYYCLWHSGGLTERCRQKGRSICSQLQTLKFRPNPHLSELELTDFGADIYCGLLEKYEEGRGVEQFWEERSAHNGIYE